MASIPVVPIVLKDVTLTLGANGYEKHVSKVIFMPKATAVRWRGLNPAANFLDISLADWDCTLEYAQDWATTNSLSKYLHANEGSTIAATFKPKSADSPSFAANLVVSPGAIGGEGGKFATASVTLPCDKPVLT